MTQLEQGSNKKYICIHGHFYQPPRENAWLEEIQSQPTASPFSNWNERIAYECYSPNRAARILDNEGNILYIVNNYEKISFNFGPTLLSWLEEHDADTYLEIIEADRKSVKENNGHGNAIAQIYNHIIMPLASEAEKELQVFWGVRDFVFRYGRNPEGMWLSETAVDTATLIALRRNGILFTILAPRQADAVKEKNGEWILCSEKAVDTGKPYKVILPDGDSIAVFFYDGSISQKVAFEGLLNDGVAFASMLMQAADQKDYDALISIATDGESYGHHHRYGEMALSSCIYHIGQHPDYILTNYAAYLAMFPPVDEVRIKENTSWSCYHGVERWRADCGCNTGSHPRWNQKYRQPLRDSLNWLSNQLSRLFNDKNKLFYNAHDALLNYIDVVLDRSEVSTEYVLRKYVIRPDSESNGVDALKLLEMMRHANLMFTSCGWFFDEISGLETTQILQYARRAITHAEYFGLFLEDGFRQRLELCPTNLPEYSSGKDVYETVVRPSEIRLLQVAMHMSVLSVFEEVPSEMTLYKFFANHETFVREEKGDQKLVIGHAVMKSVLTRAELEYNFSVLVYKGIDLIGYVKQGAPDEGFNYFIRTAKELFQQDELDKLSGYFRDYFKTGSFDFSNLFKDEKINLLNIISKRNIKNAVASFRNIFNVNYPLLYEMEKVGFPISKGFLEIVAFVFNADIIDELSVSGDVDIAKLRQLTADLKKWKVPIEDPERIAFLAERQIFAQIRRLNENIKNPIPHELIDFLLDWVYGLNLPINLWQSQNEFYEISKQISMHPDIKLEQIAKKLKFA
ncbi:MAG: DUF3536 domain-containing protein [Saprospiraceae bacterium]|nr:DUF3536 domain-containing protein [Saprospiraceae bacterium]MBX7178202.1 DUF3536 domain-containing protein [Saprospiraceae bacterium]MCB0590789.1 DUF3536 domain-containing protein [Saprospiraceae bacterium]MCO5283397.1 DUF3536 domain-containing protein [Saprospiraceae bacterium]MCO6470049.1 DUF3536 domain-containing protein [Saprospiraceae bacterium]